MALPVVSRSAFTRTASAISAPLRLCVKISTLSVVLLSAFTPATAEPIRITYWEKWSGFEADAMRAVVDQFNAAQDRVFVDFVSMSQIDRKLIVATAGGDPPDVAGIWFAQLSSFADRAALTPLDPFIERDHDRPADTWLTETYPPVFAGMQRYRGHVYALISAPATNALYWNKTAFSEAGLDPEKPPRTLAELNAFSRRLTRRHADTGALLRTGFLPQEPGWFSYAYPAWFGGQLVDEHGDIAIARDPANLAAARWERGFAETLGADQLKRFTSGFGAFASAQQAFFTGDVAMVFQGVWFDRFIAKFSPGLDYGVAPWPEATGREPGPPGQAFTLADADLLVIPRGAKHPEAAWEFIRFATSANLDATGRDQVSGVELLCLGQQKTSPLRRWSPWFEQNHPHPHIGLFRELAESPRAWHVPQIGVWTEYLREYNAAIQRVRLLDTTPSDALDYVQNRMSASWTRHRASVERQAQAAAARAGEGAP
ncbi:MAG: ABC transporter substrate-binding protein [Verrucomicrobiota bacterium]